MRRALLVCAAITFAIACTDNITEPMPDRPSAAPGTTSLPGTVAFATTTTEDGLSISTDKDDYQPGDVVHLTGYGWPANDVLDIVLTDDPLTHEPLRWSVNVGADGTFHDATYVVDDGDVDVKFTLVATTTLSIPARSLTVQFTDGVTKVTGSPLGLTFNVAWAIYTNSTCTTLRTGGNPNNNSGTANLTANKTAENVGNAGQTEFQKLTADANTSAGGAFRHWLRPDNSTTTTNPLCVPGVQGDGTPTYTAVYTASNLTIDKAHSGNFTRGANGVYTLTVRNTGDAPTQGTVTVVDQLPAGLSYVSATGTNWSCAAAGTTTITVTCTRTAGIAAGASTDVISLTVGVATTAGVGTTPPNSLTNTATVSGGGEPAANNGNNSDSDATTIVDPVDLAIDKAHTDAFVHGSNGVFTLTARNDGGTATTGTVTVTDQIPTGLAYVSAAGTDWTCGTAGNPVTVTCTRTAAIAAGGSAPAITLTVLVNAAAGAEITNTASVSGGGEPAAKNGNNSDSDKVLIDAPANAAPVAHDDVATTNEDANVDIDVLANDTDDGGAAALVVVDLTQPGAGEGSATLGADNRTVTYAPAPDFFGTATFTYKASDGAKESGVATVTVTVKEVNDAPTFTKGADETVLEDAAAQTVPGWATAINKGAANENGQTLTFTLTNDNNVLFTVQPALTATGTLSYTPAANAFGTANVTVTLKDNGGTANGGVDESSQTFQINVTPVNDAPSFTKGADQTVNEDAAAQSVSWATAISAGPNESGQAVDFILSNDTPTLFSAGPAVAPNGTLTYTPAADANGVATIKVRIHDDGGTANGGINVSAEQSFTITVRPVNDAPSFAKGGDKTVNEGDPAQSFANWATGISAGPADESGQALTLTVTNDNNALFAVQPAVSASGELTFTPSAGPNGTATVTVTLKDNGGTDNGGQDTSAPQYFTITVNNVNPTLTLLSPADFSVWSITGFANATNFVNATFTDPGSSDTHTCTIDWGNGTQSTGVITEISGFNPGACKLTPSTNPYSSTGAGIYSMTVKVNDGIGEDAESRTLIVFDPSAGFVTGGGWITSPAGACYLVTCTGSTTGKANFGFVSKYITQKDKSTPVLTGNTEFQFQAGNLNFHSESYEWLLVNQAGTNAQYKGSGRINGVTGYKFMLWATDGSFDTFRIRIWQDVGGSEEVAYDNMGTSGGFSSTPIGGGSIVVHTNGKVASK